MTALLDLVFFVLVLITSFFIFSLSIEYPFLLISLAIILTLYLYIKYALPWKPKWISQSRDEQVLAGKARGILVKIAFYLLQLIGFLAMFILTTVLIRMPPLAAIIFTVMWYRTRSRNKNNRYSNNYYKRL